MGVREVAQAGIVLLLNQRSYQLSAHFQFLQEWRCNFSAC